jgi:transposase
MERRFLEECLAKGLSLEAIGELVAKHPSTVGYWLKKHGLTASHAQRHAPKGEIDPALLRTLVEDGASIRRIAEELGAGYSTVRYWLKRLGLATERSERQKRPRQLARLVCAAYICGVARMGAPPFSSVPTEAFAAPSAMPRGCPSVDGG